MRRKILYCTPSLHAFYMNVRVYGKVDRGRKEQAERHGEREPCTERERGES